jgi:hypothetical protein
VFSSFDEALWHFERWDGETPVAIAGGIRMAERVVAETSPRDRSESKIEPDRWARLLTRATFALARLIELSQSTDTFVRETAEENAALLAPVLKDLMGTSTTRLAKGWRAQ